MESSCFDFYLQNSDFVCEPAGRKSFFFFHQNQPNLRSLPIAVSYLSVFFFLINSQSLGSRFITSWCLTCDKTLRLVFKLSNYIVSGAIYCRYWLTMKGTGMLRKKEIELESWHRDFLFLLCRACIFVFKWAKQFPLCSRQVHPSFLFPYYAGAYKSFLSLKINHFAVSGGC